jgi:methionyl-tRNA formyltransferase
MNVAALGRTQWLYDSIRAVAEAGHRIVLIGTCQAAPEYPITEQHFETLAKEFGCPYFCDSAIHSKQYRVLIDESQADVAISVNWLTLIGQSLIQQFEYGIINAHAGDLPRFRGNAVVNWAILAGERSVALTLHQMVSELDAGPILLQRRCPLTDRTYVSEVYDFLTHHIPLMFVEVLNRLAERQITPRAQSPEPMHSLRCFPRLPRDAEIDWELPAEEIARLVRASAEPFEGAYSWIGTEKIIIWRAYATQCPSPFLGIPGQVAEIRRNSGEIVILTGHGVLIVEEAEMQRAGRTHAANLVRSARIRLGMDCTQEIRNLTERMTHLETAIQRLQAASNAAECPKFL